jgi:hypothetical protein
MEDIEERRESEERIGNENLRNVHVGEPLANDERARFRRLELAPVAAVRIETHVGGTGVLQGRDSRQEDRSVADDGPAQSLGQGVDPDSRGFFLGAQNSKARSLKDSRRGRGCNGKPEVRICHLSLPFQMFPWENERKGLTRRPGVNLEDPFGRLNHIRLV